MPKQYMIHGIDLMADGGVQALLAFHRAQFGDAAMEAGDDPDATATAGERNDVSEFRAPATQEELDRLIQKRLERERAKYADYEDLRNRAAKLDEIEEAKKTAEQKQAEELETLRAKLADAEKAVAAKDREVLAQKVAAEKGVALRWITGDTEDEMKAAADLFLEDAKKVPGASKQVPGYVPSAGTGDPNVKPSSAADAAARAAAQFGVQQ